MSTFLTLFAIILFSLFLLVIRTSRKKYREEENTKLYRALFSHKRNKR